MSDTDRIHKHIVLHAPIDRVWRALTTASELSAWFGCQITDDFAPGKTVRGPISIEGYTHLTLEMQIDRIDRAAGIFSYRWHPYALDTEVDYSTEPSTTVEFHVSEGKTGTELTITETGFDRLPAERKAIAFRMNAQGWEEQLANIARFAGEPAL